MITTNTSIYNISDIESKEFQEYIHIINTARSENRSKGSCVYYENHHELPKSLGGSNSKDNLVLLTAKEHFRAHYLLSKFLLHERDMNKMIHAFWLMCNMKSENQERDYEISEETYSEIKKNLSIITSNRLLGVPKSKEHIIRMSGKIKSKETRRKISKANKGKSKSKAHIRKLIESQSIGSWITPWGIFVSSKEAVRESKYTIVQSTILKWCRFNNTTTITNKHIGQSKFLNISHLGKTFKEIGFDFIETEHSS